MKQELMDILCCPKCKSDLKLKIMKEEKGEIIEGALKCKKCGVDYPIEDAIPNLMVPDEQ
jgi:uncharacterized protein YbaR (Trm112 family)